MSKAIAKKRQPLLAALLSLLAPGLGQLYNGQWQKALVVVIVGQALTAVNGFLLVSIYAGLLAAIVLNVIYNVYCAIDALLSARKRPEYPLRRFNRVFVYALSFVLIWGLYLANRRISMSAGYEMYQVPTAAMDPTIKPGDRIMARKGRIGLIERGDILVFRSPYDGKTLIKRCIALGSDTVEIRHKYLWVNGQQAIDPSVKHEDNSENPLPNGAVDQSQLQRYWEQGKLDQAYWVRDNFGPVVVPAGCLFMMGDNRDNSFDSRFWGPLHSRDVIGKPRYIYFSRDHKRMGTTLR